jgi:hypothetical protein
MSTYNDRNKDPSQKYYNILVKNNNTGYDSSGNPLPYTSAVDLSFEQTRTIPYINHPRDFYMSVVGFEMDTQSIPVFICDPIVGQSNVNDTVYTITMNYITNTGVNNKVVQTRVQWEPEDKSATIPTGLVPDSYNMDPYYYAYTYQHFVGLVNKALVTCWTALESLPAPQLPITANTLEAFISLEGDKVILNAQNALCLTDSSGNIANNTNTLAKSTGVKIYFNTELYNLFSSFEAINVVQPLVNIGPTSSVLNSNYQLLFTKNQSSTNLKLTPVSFAGIPPVLTYGMSQNFSEYSPLPYWNPIDKVVFTTAQLPVVPQLVAAASNYYTSTQNSGTNADVSYILCDFSAQLATGTEYKPNITYIPPAEYVLNELYGDVPLSSISIYVFWKDKFGDLHPFLLEAGGTALLKIMFRKKDFYLDT